MNKIREVMQAKWNEPCIFELGRKGTRGHLVPKADDKINAGNRGLSSYIPKHLRRKSPPNLPELSEVEVMRHYFRLSQESTCVDSGFNGEGRLLEDLEHLGLGIRRFFPADAGENPLPG